MILDTITKKAVMQQIEKKANSDINWDAIKDYALKGGGLGAVAGVAHGLLSPEGDTQEKKNRSILNKALGYGAMGALGGAGWASTRELIPGFGIDDPKQVAAENTFGKTTANSGLPVAAGITGVGLAGDIARKAQQADVKKILTDPTKLSDMDTAITAGKTTGFNDLTEKAMGADAKLPVTGTNFAENKASAVRMFADTLKKNNIPYGSGVKLTPAQDDFLAKNPTIGKMWNAVQGVANKSITPDSTLLATKNTSSWANPATWGAESVARTAANPNASKWAKFLANPILNSNTARYGATGLVTGSALNYGGSVLDYMMRPEQMK